MQTYDYARAALWDTAIKYPLQSRAMTSPDHLVNQVFWKVASSETQGQLVGAGKSLKTGEKKFGRRKVKNEKKSPWGQCFNGPVPNGQASSGFWLVPENHCIFLPNHRAARLGAISRLLTRWLQCRPVARHVYSRRKVPITAQNVGEIVPHIR